MINVGDIIKHKTWDKKHSFRVTRLDLVNGYIAGMIMVNGVDDFHADYQLYDSILKKDWEVLKKRNSYINGELKTGGNI